MWHIYEAVYIFWWVRGRIYIMMGARGEIYNMVGVRVEKADMIVGVRWKCQNKYDTFINISISVPRGAC